MSKTTDALDNTVSGLVNLINSLITSRTTWVMLLGFVAVYSTSGAIEAWQQLLAYLGLGTTWVVKMGVQNIIGQVKGNGLPVPVPESEIIKSEPEFKPKPDLPSELKFPVVPEKPFDIEAFHERVLSDASLKAQGGLNPSTVFAQAQVKGATITCYGIKQAQDYWDYLIPLAYAARDYIKEKTEAAKGACKGIDAPELVSMTQQLAKVLRYRDNVYQLVNVPWAALKKSLAANDTVYHMGVLSDDLLRANTVPVALVTALDW